MKKFYFTFGLGSKNHGNYQVIFAKSEPEAYRKMHEMHGRQFAFCYNQEQWSESRPKYFTKLKPLETAYSFEEIAA